MDRLRGWACASALAILVGCGPDVGDDDTYPRNCGVEGPIDLFETQAPAYLAAYRAGDHYLVEHSVDGVTLEAWAVERCGEERALLQTSVAMNFSPRLGVAGDWLLSCDEETGAMALVDPRGVAAARPLFESVEGCRVVLVGNGLAAQQRGGSTVWFHSDPSDAGARAVVVTDAARIADPDWIPCSQSFACVRDHLFGMEIRAAGDELLVALQSEELLAFSPSTSTSRILDPGPVFAMDVLADGDRLIVNRDLGPHLIVDRRTGASFEFCCHDYFDPIRQLGDWLVSGSSGPPTDPEPPEWTNFRAHHLPTGQTTKVVGRDNWRPLARLTDDALLVEIATEHDGEHRYAVWPATGERRRVELPGERVWTLPNRDGVFAADEEHVYWLAGPDTPFRTLIADSVIVYPTDDGRIVFEPTREPGDFVPRSLRVMLLDERVVEIEPRSIYAVDVPFLHSPVVSPVERNEVVYVAEDEPRRFLRRTVLP